MKTLKEMTKAEAMAYAGGDFEVLPREQLDQTGGTGEVEGRESAGPDIDRTDGATQEGSSRGLVPFVAPSPRRMRPHWTMPNA